MNRELNKATLLLLVCLAFVFPGASAQRTGADLAVEDRIAHQRAIEEVYWRHRLWPEGRADAKPSLDQVMPPEQIAKKVQDHLRDLHLLESLWGERLTPARLQAEMDRMARNTQRPKMLHELFAALGNDPAVIAECLAGPALAGPLLAQRYASDGRVHGELRRAAERERQAFRSVAQMKRTTGKYRELEWIRSSSGKAEAPADEGAGRALNPHAWAAKTQELARLLGADPSPADREPPLSSTSLAARAVSAVREEDDRFYVIGLISSTEDRIRIAMVEWLKESLNSWRARTAGRLPIAAPTAPNGYKLPSIALGDECTDDTWRPTVNVPGAREEHTAVWTGTEMIVWGGLLNNAHNRLGSGERYDPATDTWVALSTGNAPQSRYAHTAVWTGTEMIIWGGISGVEYLNSGGKYNPANDSWTASSTSNAPAGRYGHTAVWTGREMIVWGGRNNSDTPPTAGGRYYPLTDTWLPTSTVNAPGPRRQFHTAVWTGTEMIVWGGSVTVNNTSDITNTGARYNPLLDTWVPTDTTTAPTGRHAHTAVWSGSRMIVWGGISGAGLGRQNTGGLYDPLTNSWIPTGMQGVPEPHHSHRAVWTGTEMIVWGGDTLTYAGSGGRYHPASDTWSATSLVGAPSYRVKHTAVWTGDEMIVFGGSDYRLSFATGGRYNPASDSWIATNSPSVPAHRSQHTAVWTGSEMIIWGGEGLRSGGRYDPATDTWAATTLHNAPAGRADHTAVWTGSEMIVWGGWASDGYFTERFNSGGRYDPALDQWTATNLANAPVGRHYHTAVFGGSEMIVWGGEGPAGLATQTGGRYDVASGVWTATSTENAPAARRYATSIWTGTEMIIWGGSFNTGGRYHPGTDSWSATSMVNAPPPVSGNTALWTGSEMIVWGGYRQQYSNTGGRYDPATDSWVATAETGAPQRRSVHSAVWTGREMIVWGGTGGFYNVLKSGGRYDPAADNWKATSELDAPWRRSSHTAVWTGDEMIIWGGHDGTVLQNIGHRYSAQPSAPVHRAASRVTHGNGQSYEIELPLSDSPGIESRSGGGTDDFEVIVTFFGDVAIGSNPQAAVTSGRASVGSGGASNGGDVTISGNTVTIPITNVANAQTITVTLYCVNGAGNVVIPLRRLLGDTNASGSVNASDIAQVKAVAGQPVTSANFREDVTANGVINASDVGQVKAQSGTALP